jgi:signal-transduction protein with cAMP-binding, CBS, and nucleotidyltransferase domain
VQGRESAGARAPPVVAPTIAGRSQTAIFGKRVRDFVRASTTTVAGDTPVAAAIAEMAATRSSSAIVVDPAGRVSGIFTERDVTRRVALGGIGDVRVDSVATKPVHTVTADDYLFRAVARMRRLNLRHLPVVDAAGRPIGMLNLIDAMAAAADQMLRQLDRLSGDGSIAGLAEIKKAQIDVARELLADNLPAPDIQTLITEINHDIHRQVLDDAVRDLREAGWGEPPAPFTLLIMGSGGRGESFLYPDQDNGFILADYPDAEHARIDAYFIALAERFNDDLDRVGFPLCKGEVMARNPLWRKTAGQWREQVALWARRRSPVALLFADIFFDFRAVAGPVEPAEQLRAHVTDVLKTYPALLSMIGEAEASHSVALGWFGGLKTDTSGQSPGRMDLKLHGTMPLVGSVRLWALKHGVGEVGTLARIAALAERGAITRDDAHELAQAFHQITFHLLRQQLEDARAGGRVGNYVDPAALRRSQRDELRRALRAIERFHKGTRAAFAGGR